MEVEQDNSSTVGTVDTLEPNKGGAETVNSSEDEGISEAHNPAGVTGKSDAENNISVPDSNSEVNSDRQNPLDVAGDATKSGAFMSDESEDEAINKNLSYSKRQTAILSDDYESIVPRPLASNRPSVSSDEEEGGDSSTDKKRIKKRIIQRIDSDSDDDMELFQRRSSSQPSAERPKVWYCIVFMC